MDTEYKADPIGFLLVLINSPVPGVQTLVQSAKLPTILSLEPFQATRVGTLVANQCLVISLWQTE